MTELANVSAKSIVRAVASAAERWSDGDFPPRVRALERIADRTGYSLPVAEYALDRLFFSITERDLQAVIDAELGGMPFLDGFASRAGRPDAWAAPAGRACVIASRTTIGVALVPAIFALCAKCDVLVKDREDLLAAAFFETLREELDEFAQAARASTWNPHDETAPDLHEFDAVAAFGSDQTLATIARSLRPGARFIGYGSRASAGYVCREALRNDHAARELAAGAARDALLYESEGCLCLHALFVERGGAIAPEDVARILAAEMERASVEFPPGRIDPAQAARFANYRNLAAFRGAAGSGAAYAGEEAAYAVVYDPPPAEPPQFLPRTLGVIPVDDPAQALAYLREHAVPIEAFALAGGRADAVRAALDAGAVRLARFGELQQPPLAGNHGGRPRIAEFVKWIDKDVE